MQQRRERRKHTEWVVLIEEQEQSEQTIKAFCAGRDLALASFQQHRSRWKKDRASNSGFAEVGISERPAPVHLRIDNRPWTLEISPDFDAAFLKRVLHVLSS